MSYGGRLVGDFPVAKISCRKVSILWCLAKVMHATFALILVYTIGAMGLSSASEEERNGWWWIILGLGVGISLLMVWFHLRFTRKRLAQKDDEMLELIENRAEAGLVLIGVWWVILGCVSLGWIEGSWHIMVYLVSLLLSTLFMYIFALGD
ncbi:hypothetical protein JD969_09355 [Planctomycetota bacterium]|nr:hypothetical protein JD969_09355 [Planctomycetota bacterium]